MQQEHELSAEEWLLLEQCYRQLHDPLFKSAMAILKSSHVAQDIVQDTFLYGADHIRELKASNNPGGWLYKAMQYRILHAIRTRDMLLKRQVPLEEAYRIPKSDEDITIRELDPQNTDLQLIVRYYEYGYSLQEIADEWGISVSAAKMRIKRARERLQKDPNVKNLKKHYF